MRVATIEVDEYGGTSLQGMVAMTTAAAEERLGPPHHRDIDGKVSVWWGFRTGPHRWSVYERIGDDELHIGGTTPSAMWIALAALRVPSSVAWHPSECPREWWGQLVNAEVPRKTPNAGIQARP